MIWHRKSFARRLEKARMLYLTGPRASFSACMPPHAFFFPHVLRAAVYRTAPGSLFYFIIDTLSRSLPCCKSTARLYLYHIRFCIGFPGPGCNRFTTSCFRAAGCPLFGGSEEGFGRRPKTVFYNTKHTPQHNTTTLEPQDSVTKAWIGRTDGRTAMFAMKVGAICRTLYIIIIRINA